MTKTELRVLTLLSHNAGRLKLSEISPQMSRYSAEERRQALHSLEELGIISSAQVPHSGPPGGVPGLVYWITDDGKPQVQKLQSEGRISTKKRGTK